MSLITVKEALTNAEFSVGLIHVSEKHQRDGEGWRLHLAKPQDPGLIMWYATADEAIDTMAPIITDAIRLMFQTQHETRSNNAG